MVQIVGEPEFGPPKTKSSRRVIPIPQVLVDTLAEHLTRFGSGSQDLVFTDNGSCALRRNRFSGNVWRQAMAASKSPPGTVFHDLRHHYASLLINGGQSVKTVRVRLGHKSAVETLDVYGHLWPEAEDLTRSVVEAGLRRVAFDSTEDAMRTSSPA